MTLAAEGVSFSYSAGGRIINDWSVDFDAGSMTAIMGASGCGKSTCLYILGLMLTPERGTVWLNGRAVSTWPDAARARLRAENFGFVFQDAALDISRSVLDNVIESSLYNGMTRAAALAKGEALLERFDVRSRSLARPGEVSGGQAQRIALARALVNSPTVLLADEPTGNLDDATAAMVMASLREEARSGATVVVVTHDSRVAAACDQAIAL